MKAPVGESAVYGVANKGIKTQDIGGTKTTSEFTKAIISSFWMVWFKFDPPLIMGGDNS